jgi:hypothetical protein
MEAGTFQGGTHCAGSAIFRPIAARAGGSVETVRHRKSSFGYDDQIPPFQANSMTYAPPLNTPSRLAPSNDAAPVAVRTLAARTWWVFLIAQCLVILGIAAFFRCWRLDAVPGINGDEAWYGVQVEMLLHGEQISWRTPTGNLLNLFFFLPLLAIHAFTDPSFALLRIIPLFNGLLALAVNFLLCRRAFDLRTATISTIALAVLPINIAYSRFAWDASQSLLFTSPVVYAPFIAARSSTARVRWSITGAITLIAAALVHPTNVFLAPWLAIGLAFAWSDRLRNARTHYRGACAATALILVVFAATCITHFWPRVANHILATESYTSFAGYLASLFSGVTVYDYIAGTLGPNARASSDALTVQIALTSITAFLAALIAWAAYRRIRRGKSPLDLAMATAWVACVAAFFVFAGPEAIRPHFERYAICLVAPTILLAARGLQWWMQPSTRFSVVTAPLLLLLAWAALFVFKHHYFDEFATRGGNSHRTFRTADDEPKQAALSLILEQSPSNKPIEIQTSEWWLYWPLRYLAYAHDNVTVQVRNADDLPRLSEQSGTGRTTWLVEFAEEEAGWQLKRAFDAADRHTAERYTISDSANRPLLLLFQLPRGLSQSCAVREAKWDCPPPGTSR